MKPLQVPFPKDCEEIKRIRNNVTTGVYFIQPNTQLPPLAVHCDMNIAGGGWTMVTKTVLRIRGNKMCSPHFASKQEFLLLCFSGLQI